MESSASTPAGRRDKRGDKLSSVSGGKGGFKRVQGRISQWGRLSEEKPSPLRIPDYTLPSLSPRALGSLL